MGDNPSVTSLIAAANALLVSEESIFLGKHIQVRILVYKKSAEREEDQLTGF